MQAHADLKNRYPDAEIERYPSVLGCKDLHAEFRGRDVTVEGNAGIWVIML